jgi:hypothetical protein
MKASRFAACFSVITFTITGAFLSSAQQRAGTSDDEAMRFAGAFLHAVYPELTGKKYVVTFETARSYDHPVSDVDRMFFVDIGDGAKYEVLCCFGGSIKEVRPPQLPDDKDLGAHTPLPAPLPVHPEKPLHIDSKGASHPYQYRSTVFIFDPRGRLKTFIWNRTPSATDLRFYDKLALHPEITDKELIAAYKETGAKYAFGDREAFERDLPIGKLEQFLGKLKILRKEFSVNTIDRLDRLGFFGYCSVFLESDHMAGEHRKYKAKFEPKRGELVELRIVTDNEEPHSPEN